MTEKVFWNNPYQPEIISVVTQITGNNVELSHTIFTQSRAGRKAMKEPSLVFVWLRLKNQARVLFILLKPHQLLPLAMRL